MNRRVATQSIGFTGHIITNNVFAANVAIWNSGNAEIPKDAIREPFRIILSGNIKLLDLTLTSYSSPFEGFHVKNMDGSISWEHFDAGQGLKIRIVYISNVLEKVILKGTAIDTHKRDLQGVQNEIAHVAQKEMILLLGLIIGIVINFVVWVAWRKQFPRWFIVQLMILILLTVPTGITIIKIYFFGIGLPTPPF